jgi:hypothetical protein
MAAPRRPDCYPLDWCKWKSKQDRPGKRSDDWSMRDFKGLCTYYVTYGVTYGTVRRTHPFPMMEDRGDNPGSTQSATLYCRQLTDGYRELGRPPRGVPDVRIRGPGSLSNSVKRFGSSSHLASRVRAACHRGSGHKGAVSPPPNPVYTARCVPRLGTRRRKQDQSAKPLLTTSPRSSTCRYRVSVLL